MSFSLTKIIPIYSIKRAFPLVLLACLKSSFNEFFFVPSQHGIIKCKFKVSRKPKIKLNRRNCTSSSFCRVSKGSLLLYSRNASIFCRRERLDSSLFSTSSPKASYESITKVNQSPKARNLPSKIYSLYSEPRANIECRYSCINLFSGDSLSLRLSFHSIAIGIHSTKGVRKGRHWINVGTHIE